jgi:hypothetical protein
LKHVEKQKAIDAVKVKRDKKYSFTGFCPQFNNMYKLSSTRIAGIWYRIINRCYNEKFPEYKNYGAKGITVCKEWESFRAFVIWASNNGYKKNSKLERIDVDKNYEPDNCIWTH